MVAGFVHIADGVVLNDADGQAQGVIDRAVPHRITPREVVVDGDDVHPATDERVQVDGGDSGEGLALASSHLRYLAVVERHAAHQLDIEGPLLDATPGHFAGHGERFGEEVLEILVLGEAGAELRGLASQRFVIERGHVIGEAVDLRHRLAEALDLFFV